MKFSNENPTKVEKVMFEKYGLYLVEKNVNSYRYASIHIENQRTYPFSVEVESSMVEWKNDVVFDTLSETVSVDGFYDAMGIELILERMKELNFKF